MGSAGSSGRSSLRVTESASLPMFSIVRIEGWTPDRLAPLLAGLDQLVPWLMQWHNDVHPEYDLRMGDYYRDFVRDEAQALGLTPEAIRAWPPPAKAGGGRRKKKGP